MDTPDGGRVRWEYRVKTLRRGLIGQVDPKALQEALDRAGRGGWQCAGVIGPDRRGGFKMIFQRPMRPEDDDRRPDADAN